MIFESIGLNLKALRRKEIYTSSLYARMCSRIDYKRECVVSHAIDLSFSTFYLHNLTFSQSSTIVTIS